MGFRCPEYIKSRTTLVSEYYKIKKAKLFIDYNKDLLADGTFYVVLKFSYQVLITRNYVSEFSNNLVIIPINLHCDFEKSYRL
ncbi:hypothetical protein U3516DRAFT_789829 [Neocallimastix sp. 'constans']